MEGEYLGLKGAVWISLAFTALMGVVLAYTVYGKKYAVGGNWQAARLAGIRSNRVLVSCYVISGLGAGLAGVIYAGRYGTGCHERLRLTPSPSQPSRRPSSGA